MDYFHNLQTLKPNKPNYSGFPLNFPRAQSQSLGAACPSMVLEVVPGDHFNFQQHFRLDTAAMLSPLMHNVDLRTEFYYVPYRICSDYWEDFIKDPKTNLTLPSVFLENMQYLQTQDPSRIQIGSLADYLGWPVDRMLEIYNDGDTMNPSPCVNILDFIAYQLIWHYWYQDFRLQEFEDFEGRIESWRKLGLTMTSPSTDYTDELQDLFTLRYRDWFDDYFTTCKREPQMGDPVQLPFSGTAPVANNEADFTDANAQINTLLRDIRAAVDIEDFLIRQNAAGFDYRETLLQHFGVWNNDGRLQRPELIGAYVQRLLNNEVTVTADTDTANPGELASVSRALGSSKNFDYSCTEHGLIIGISTLVPESMYFQGVDRRHTRVAPLDFYFPEFQDLGDQPVFEQELYLCGQNDTTANNDIFGYIARYGEYKQGKGSVHGFMRNYFDTWHLAREFTAPPVLCEPFLEINPNNNNLNRNFSVLTDNTKVNVHNFIIHFHNEVHSSRPFNYYDQPHGL